MISHLKRLFNGAQCIPGQVVIKNLIIAQNTNTFIENSTSSGGNEELCNFARNLAEHNKSSTSQQYDGISLIGKVKRCTNLQAAVIKALQQRFGSDVIVSNIMVASRMKKDHQVYHSLAYKRKEKSCSYLVQYPGGVHMTTAKAHG